VLDDLLQDLKRVHRAEVKGDVRLGGGTAADRRQNRLGEIGPAIRDGVANRRI
jgi:hypothetical protein